MGWTFYNNQGNPPTQKSNEVLSSGTLVMSLVPYTSPEPEGFLYCNGQEVLKNDYLDLFNEIGTTFGAAVDPVNYFKLPDFRSKMPRGIVSSAGGLGPVSGAGGSKTHTHSLAAHNHVVASGLSHSHTISGTHSHTFDPHQHELNSHTHGAGTLTVGTSINNWTNIKAGSTQQDTVSSSHTHSGDMLGTTSAAGTGEYTSNLTSSNSGTSSYGLASYAFASAVSSTSAPATSGASSNLPPYFALTFLIKT